MIGAELGLGVSEGVEDVDRIEEGVEEGVEELATGEFVAEGPLVVLLRIRLEQNGFVA
jgi:hypothetical protein